jgi:uncharacterized protein
MDFEWDEAKRDRNLRKHGIDFLRACRLFDGRPLCSYASPREGEQRVVSVGLLDDRLIAVVWIERDGAIRVISVRRARHGEKAAYQALYG